MFHLLVTRCICMHYFQAGDNHLSKDSLFPSEEHLAETGESPLVREVLDELRKKDPTATKPRYHRSEPFPDGNIAFGHHFFLNEHSD